MIRKLSFSLEGYVHCKSRFYTSYTCIDLCQLEFFAGINKFTCDIDSEFWGVSYLISMIDKLKLNKDFFCENITILLDGRIISLSELTKKCCYLDETIFPLFSLKHKSVKQLIEKGIKNSKKDLTVEQICDLFRLTYARVERPITQTGNERFRAMAAVAYSFGREIFCFPWLSKKKYDYYGNNILELLDIIEKLGMIAIVPVGR